VISGATRVAGVIGDPVRHSLSPVLHNAAFAALGLDWVFAAFEVPAGDGAVAVDAVRALGLGGLSVTMPHKSEVIPALDRLSPSAARLQSVNCIHWVGDDLVGESTDGPGFVSALRHDEGFSADGARVAVLGAGGAARAVVLALADAGASSIAVVNRSADRGAAAAALAPEVATAVAGTDDEAAAAAVRDADLVVNATSVGMAGTANEGEVPLDVSLLHGGQLVVDLVYHPLRTPLLVAARARGAVAVTGLGMLIHQAAFAFRLWTGEEPPLEVMSAAALGSLEQHR